MATKDLLLIDDEPAIGALLALTAARCGFDVVRTTDPEAFRAEYLKREQDVILLDLQMPEKDGIELIRFLADRQCTSQIVIISGLDRRVVETSVRFGEELGLNMLRPLSKPFRAAALVELLGPSEPQTDDD